MKTDFIPTQLVGDTEFEPGEKGRLIVVLCDPSSSNGHPDVPSKSPIDSKFTSDPTLLGFSDGPDDWSVSVRMFLR